MNERMVKSLKWLLLAGVALLTIFLMAGIVLALDWPWWVALCLLLLLAGIAVGAMLLRSVLLRRRERHFVREVIEQEQGGLNSLSDGGRQHLDQLADQWKEGVGALRSSHLRRRGNPLYVLPWYLVIGESGSGKSTSLASARLASPFTDARRAAGDAGTRNCDWWFFEESVVLDTAGRYAVPVNGDRDRDEWQKLLALLVRHRRREPLNGLVLTVAADRLLSGGQEENAEDGRTMRRRVDELMRALGVRVPVYVLVTKCDLVEGMNCFAELLPEKALRQPMGMINRDLTADVGSFTAKALETVTERLRSLRLQILHRPEARDAAPALAFFPEEFAGLREGLTAFMEGTFRENPYQETPLLRGVFFASGRQTGSPRSRFSETLGTIAGPRLLPDTNRGIFLHDFFARVLPADRALLAPTHRAVQWRAVTGNLGILSWLLLGLALCGLLSFSFVKNMATIREVSRQFERTPPLNADPVNNLLVLESIRQGILRVEERNRAWWAPRLGLNESRRVEAVLKDKFCSQFRDGFLAPYDRHLAEGVNGLSAATQDELFARYAIHLARRINILTASRAGRGLDDLRALPQPASLSFMAAETPSVADAHKRFGELYLHYLAWRSDSPDVAREAAQLQGWLRRSLALKDGSLSWLAPWVDRHGGLSPVTLAEFWGGGVPAPDEPTIAPSFTGKGKDRIDSLMRELETAVGDSRLLAKAREGFTPWHRTRCIQVWQEFAASFPRGAERLRGSGEWQQTAARMATGHGPYFAFINRMSQELHPLAGTAEIPSFAAQLFAFQVARAGGAVSAPDTATHVTGESRRLMASIRRRLGNEAAASAIDPPPMAAHNWQEYQTALAAIAPAASSRQQAFQLASQTFTDDPATGKTPFHAAWNAAARLKRDIAGAGADDALWRLVTGPLDFLWGYVRREAGCQLQTLWEEQVLAPTLGMPPQQAGPMLLGPDGLAWRFVKGPAAPFVRGTAAGYAPRQTLGGALPLEGSLFAFLGKGAQLNAMTSGRQSNYTVAIKGLPTDANPEARIKPHGTRLELQCAGQAQALVNQNFPVGKTFYWSPDSCGDVIFQIEAGDQVLTKRYAGPQAFPDFLREFASGHRTFAAGEFPGEKDALARMGITSIRASYQFIGSQQVIRQGGAMAGATAPRMIARCW